MDGEEVSLEDHVNAYSTTVEQGLDGKASHESRGGKQGTTVDQALKTAPFSESIKKILKTISASEGGFTTVNTYDQAVLTWGMLQWTGGSGGDLEDALRIIKRVSPAAFAARFSKYGIDVRGDNLVVTQPQGETLVGEPAAKAVQSSPALTGVMSRAGMDPAIQVGELTAAVQTKIDAPLAATLLVEVHGHPTRIRVGDIFTSEYGVGCLPMRPYTADSREGSSPSTCRSS